VVGITIPLVLAITFVTMHYWGMGLHKISLGSLIIALGLLVDDAIIAVEMMVRKLEEGYDQAPRRHLRLRRHGDADADRHADHRRGFLPIGMAKSSVGEYTFAIFAVTVGGAGHLLVWCRSTSCPTWARWLLHKASRTWRRRTSCSTRPSTPLSGAW
jgi:multidrug efflux pump